jgi:hypothetical protein
VAWVTQNGQSVSLACHLSCSDEDWLSHWAKDVIKTCIHIHSCNGISSDDGATWSLLLSPQCSAAVLANLCCDPHRAVVDAC